MEFETVKNKSLIERDLMAWVDAEIYAARAYNCYFVKMRVLNADIDCSKVSYHPIMTIEEFRLATCNNSKMNNELMTDYYTRLFLN
jgi:hypothetical protein